MSKLPGELGDWLDETARLVHVAMQQAGGQSNGNLWGPAYVAAEAIADLLCPEREREVEVLKP